MDRAGRGRPVRPSALRQPFNANGDGPTISSDDDDEAKPSARPSRRMTNKVDLSKLDMSSLLRYRKFYRLGETPPSSTKEDLVPSVARHFAAQGVDEEEVLLKFVLAVQRVSKQVPRGQQLPITRRPMGVNKPVNQRR